MQRRQEEQRMRAQGHVRYGGEWVTLEEKEAAQMKKKGLILFEGEWVTPDRKNEILAEQKKRQMFTKP